LDDWEHGYDMQRMSQFVLNLFSTIDSIRPPNFSRFFELHARFPVSQWISSSIGTSLMRIAKRSHETRAA
jgi:hypothetical protein